MRIFGVGRPVLYKAGSKYWIPLTILSWQRASRHTWSLLAREQQEFWSSPYDFEQVTSLLGASLPHV